VNVQFLCPGCEVETALPLPWAQSPWTCPRCGKKAELHSAGGLSEGSPVSRCCLCAGQRFYAQRDFNQKLGCAVAGVGAALSPFTYGISLLVCLAIDLALFLSVPEVVVCYRCGAIYRGTVRDPRHTAFDLHTSDIDREERKYLEKETTT